LTHYAESKLRAEESLRELADARFSPVFLRHATAYGYSPRLRTDLVVNDLTAQAVLTGKIALRSDGTAWRPLVHVDDISAAFVAMLSAPTPVVHGQAFNVGRTDENYRVRDIARIVAGVVVGSRVSIYDQASPDSRDYRVSCDRIAAEVPEFRPTWSVHQGVKQLAEAYRRHALRLDDAIGPRFRRLTRIRELIRSGKLDDQFRWTEAPRLSMSAGMAAVQVTCRKDKALRSPSQ
jgi:nucleoside-diphosphate-sugar epimerase